MENNQPEKLDKKLFIKKALVDIAIAIVYFLLPTFITYGRIPVKFFLIVLGVCIVLGSTIAFFSLKYANRMLPTKFRKIPKIFIILGILMVIVNLALIIIERGKTDYYSGVILGLIFIYYSRSDLLRVKKLELANTPAPEYLMDSRKWLWIVIRFIVVLTVCIVFYFVKTGVFTKHKEIPIDKSAEHSEIIGNVYRNLKYHFRIEFPEGWKIEPGDGIYIVQKASFQNSTIGVITRQVDLKGSQEFSSIKDTRSLQKFIDAFIESSKEEVSDMKIINYGETKIGNEPAYWMESSMGSQVLLMYFLAKGDTMYSISAATASDEYSKIKPLFMQSVSTFVFENY
jgi:hypothetical protein